MNKVLKLNNSFRNFCLAGVETVAQSEINKKLKTDPRQEGIKIKKYILTKEGERSTRCRLLIKPEHEFTSYIWKKYANAQN